MTNKKTQLSQEDLKVVNDAKANVAFSKALRDKAEAELKAADAEYRGTQLQVKNILLMAYLNYGLAPYDSIDADGKFVRKEVKEVKEVKEEVKEEEEVDEVE